MLKAPYFRDYSLMKQLVFLLSMSTLGATARVHPRGGEADQSRGERQHRPPGRGLHSSTSQLNLSRYCHYKSMDNPAYPAKGAYDEPKSGRVSAPAAGSTAPPRSTSQPTTATRAGSVTPHSCSSLIQWNPKASTTEVCHSLLFQLNLTICSYVPVYPESLAKSSSSVCDFIRLSA